MSRFTWISQLPKHMPYSTSIEAAPHLDWPLGCIFRQMHHSTGMGNGGRC